MTRESNFVRMLHFVAELEHGQECDQCYFDLACMIATKIRRNKEKKQIVKQYNFSIFLTLDTSWVMTL
jgi:hypothetical protein